MKGLKKRVENLEKIIGKGKTINLYVKKVLDGGYIYNGDYYEDAEALDRVIEHDEHDLIFLIIQEFV